MIKYVLCPGKVISINDGDRHYIGAMQLAKLYGVPVEECAIYEPAPWWTASLYQSAYREHEGLIRLRPRSDGDYRIPEK
jgi:hypothetical protein